MITLYQRTDCPFCWKVRLALAEYAIDYQSIATSLGEKHPDILRYNPKGSVPLLLDGDTTIWESAVALEYLNEAYTQGQLLPGNAAERCQLRLLHNYSDALVGPALRDLVFEKRSKPSAEWDQDKIQHSEHAWRRCLDQLESWLDSQPFFGQDFSVAECALLPRFGVAEVYSAGVDDRHPGLLQWYSQLTQRNSYTMAYPDSFIGIKPQQS